jgi:hypothetical protein
MKKMAYVLLYSISPHDWPSHGVSEGRKISIDLGYIIKKQ